jgi:HD superfamily phosphohydrolase
VTEVQQIWCGSRNKKINPFSFRSSWFGTNPNPKQMSRSTLSPIALKVAELPIVQRLSKVPQLGFVSNVWPFANYDRLTHSVGVATLSKHVLTQLWEPTPRHLLWIELAGLLHDVGHGPFSHVFDRILHDCGLETQQMKTHEERGQLLIQHTLGAIPEITPEDIEVVKFLIHPPSAAEKWLNKPHCLPAIMTNIVSNGEHGIDTDRLDYLLRDQQLASRIADSHMEPRVTARDVKRLIRNSQLLTDTGQWKFAFQDAAIVRNILRLRTALHRNLYLHPKVLEHEMYFRDFLISFVAKDPGAITKTLFQLDSPKQCIEYVDMLDCISNTFLDHCKASKSKYQWIPHSASLQNPDPDMVVFKWDPIADRWNQRHIMPLLKFVRNSATPSASSTPSQQHFPEDGTVEYHFCKQT